MLITQEDINFAKCLEKESTKALDKYARANPETFKKFIEVWDNTDEINRKAILYKLIAMNKIVNNKIKIKARRWLDQHKPQENGGTEDEAN